MFEEGILQNCINQVYKYVHDVFHVQENFRCCSMRKDLEKPSTICQSMWPHRIEN